MTKKSDEDSIHPSETAYDKAIKRMEEREAHIFNTPAMQIAADPAEQIRIQQAPLIQPLQPLQDALQPYHNLIDQNSLGLVAASLSSVAQTIVPDNAVGSMTKSLNVVATAIQPYQQDMNLFNSNVLAAFEAAKDFYVNKLGFSVIRENYRPERKDWKLDLRVNEHTELEIFAEENPPKRVNRPKACGLRHLAFCVDSVEQTVREMAEVGIECEPIRVDDYTGKKMTFFHDPDGLPLELHE